MALALTRGLNPDRQIFRAEPAAEVATSPTLEPGGVMTSLEAAALLRPSHDPSPAFKLTLPSPPRGAFLSNIVVQLRSFSARLGYTLPMIESSSPVLSASRRQWKRPRDGRAGHHCSGLATRSGGPGPQPSTLNSGLSTPHVVPLVPPVALLCTTLHHFAAILKRRPT
jgi:hypothetical protein